MEARDFFVARIEGDYAILKDEKSGEEMFIAMALLPMGTDIGSRLHYEDFSYELLD
ncbi:MAG: hypothetical protein IKA53_03780 [Clostridia bacterium]|nr:hypothetical protein [Clostridia bacterium]MBQ8268179.1 hypothetical protein [Clostridia bacterium]MBR2325144.1 hypothetical protein [Clostridia bacterium]